MANVKISALPDGTPLDGTEQVPFVQSANTVKGLATQQWQASTNIATSGGFGLYRFDASSFPYLASNTGAGPAQRFDFFDTGTRTDAMTTNVNENNPQNWPSFTSGDDSVLQGSFWIHAAYGPSSEKVLIWSYEAVYRFQANFGSGVWTFSTVYGNNNWDLIFGTNNRFSLVGRAVLTTQDGTKYNGVLTTNDSFQLVILGDLPNISASPGYWGGNIWPGGVAGTSSAATLQVTAGSGTYTLQVTCAGSGYSQNVGPLAFDANAAAVDAAFLAAGLHTTTVTDPNPGPGTITFNDYAPLFLGVSNNSTGGSVTVIGTATGTYSPNRVLGIEVQLTAPVIPN